MYPLILTLLTLTTDTFPSEASLLASVDRFHARQLEAELTEYHDSRKNDWLRFLPNVGITYDLQGRPRPAIGLNTALQHQVARTREEKARKRQALEKRSALQAEQDRAEVRRLLARRALLLRQLTAERRALALDRQLYQIQQARYERREIGVEAHLKAQREYLAKEERLAALELQLAYLELEVLVAARW